MSEPIWTGSIIGGKALQAAADRIRELERQLAEPAKTPQLIMVFPDRMTDQELKALEASITNKYPMWPIMIVDGDVAFYQLRPNGDYERVTPLPILDGPSVVDYLKGRTDAE